MASEQRTRKKASPMSAFLLLLTVLGGGFALRFVLRLFNLQFRAWIVALFFAVLIFLVLRWLFHLFRTPPLWVAVVVLIITVVVGFHIFVMFIFLHNSDYVTEKYGQKMVAQKITFQEISIVYYEYKNPVFCGYTQIGYEWYSGSSNHDPFDYAENPQPITFEFFDPQGNLIASTEHPHD